MFKSCFLHISVSAVSDIAENRAESARVRAIRNLARTRKAPRLAQIGRIGAIPIRARTCEVRGSSPRIRLRFLGKEKDNWKMIEQHSID